MSVYGNSDMRLNFQQMPIHVGTIKYFSQNKAEDDECYHDGCYDDNESYRGEEAYKFLLNAYESSEDKRKIHWCWLKCFHKNKIKRIHVKTPSTAVKRLLPKLPFPGDIIVLISKFLSAVYYLTWVPFEFKYYLNGWGKKNEIGKVIENCLINHSTCNPYYYFVKALEKMLMYKINYIKNVQSSYYLYEDDIVFLHGPLRPYNKWL